MRAFIYILFFAFIGCASKSDDSATLEKIQNIKTFAKVYGYVKYFHPSDEAAQINWNAFAIHGAKNVEKTKSKRELIGALNTLFKPIAPSINFSAKRGKFDRAAIIPKNSNGFKPTYWQHLGVGFGADPELRTPYSSSRVNGNIYKDHSYVISKLIMRIEASKYKGKKVKYTSWAKKEGANAEKGYLRLVLENSDGTMDLEREPVTDDEWKRYEVIAAVDSLTNSFQIGAAYKGKGSLLFHSPKLFYENEDGWTEIPLINQDFESKITFKKYQLGNWYFEGIGYSCSIAETDHNRGGKSVILKYTGILEKEKGKSLFTKAPKFGELIEEDLGGGIYAQIPLVLYSNDEGTYPKSDHEALKVLLNDLLEVPEDASELSVRLGNVINTYNVFQHFYPYFDVVEVNWEQELGKALSKSFIDISSRDHLITLQKFTAPLKDGHIGVSYNKDSNWYTPPITWEWIEDKLVITNVLEREVPLKVGDVVTQINGESTVEYFEEVNSRISAGTVGWLNSRAESLSLVGEKDSELNIVVNERSIKLTRNTYPFGPEHRKSTYEKINDSVYYLNINSISMDDIEKLIPDLAKSKSIICDLRYYPNSNHEFISYLLKENDTVTSWMQIPQSIYPNRQKRRFQKTNWMLPAKKPYLGDKQIIFITKGTAISYAESYMGFVQGYDLATIVGQSTAGTNGNINQFRLPGGFRIRWTGMKVLKHDGSQLHGIGFLPDIYVNSTIEGIKAEKDECLEKAIELTR